MDKNMLNNVKIAIEESNSKSNDSQQIQKQIAAKDVTEMIKEEEERQQDYCAYNIQNDNDFVIITKCKPGGQVFLVDSTSATILMVIAIIILILLGMFFEFILKQAHYENFRALESLMKKNNQHHHDQ